MGRKLLPVLVFSVMLVSVAGFPTVPMNVYGYVTEGGEPVPDRRVEFRYNGSVVHSVSTDSDGFYDAYVPYSSDYSGEEVRIFIGETNPENFSYDQGTSVNIDMSGDFRPPDISDVEVPTVLNESAIVAWSTDENASSRVEYGENENSLDLSVEDDNVNLTKDHRLNLSDLNEQTQYFFRVISEDANGNQRVDDDNGDLYTFTTKGGSGQKQENQTKKTKKQKKQGKGKQASGGFSQKEKTVNLQGGKASVTAENVSESLKVDLVPETDSQSLQSVKLDLSGSLEEFTVDVESLDEKPEAVPEAGRVYRYQSIDTSASEEEVSGATITFRVKKQWLQERNATLDQVVMRRYTDQWEDLETEYLQEEGDFYRFEANSPGFSFFAVALQEVQEKGGVKFENISIDRKEGQAPLNITVSGELVNTGLSEVSKTVTLYLDGEPETNRTYQLGGGGSKNFSFDLMIEEPGVHTVEVGDRAFTVNAEGESGLLFPALGVLLLLLVFGGSAVYLQYSGIVDFEELILENVGGEEERIEVEEGHFTFKGSEESSEEVDGHVEIELDLSREEPTVQERRVYSQAGRALEMNWAEELREEASEYEEELSRRIGNFIHDVKEQQSDGLICSICMDEFDTEDGLHMHQALTHDISCEVCGEKFETVRGLHIHQGMTHGEISHNLYQN